MIKNIQIKNFKSIFSNNIEIGNLNVFTGVNASGKSTFIQSLLLIRQSYTNGNLIRSPKSLIINDQNALTNLGNFKDILSFNAKKNDEKVKFSIEFENIKLNIKSEEYDISKNRDSNVIIIETNKIDQNLFKENLFSDRFQYLSAERIEPREDYPRFGINEFLGKKGEFTPHYIEKYGNKDIDIKELSIKGNNAKSFTLNDQVNDWLNEISESVKVNAKENLNTNRIELSYQQKFSDGTSSQNLKPQNIGFGITHTLPILVSVLSAKPGDLIIIENPETHLHPKGQTNIANLIAIAAENGVQFIIETHSDHFINGLRVSVKKRLINKNKIFLYYFSKNIKNNNSIITKINIEDDGGLDSWPNGFFDEWDKQLNELI